MENTKNECICILRKDEESSICYLSYTSDYEKTLEQINSEQYNGFYSYFAHYNVSCYEEAENIFEMIDSINPNAKMDNNPNIYKYSPTDALEILTKIAKLLGTTDHLHVLSVSSLRKISENKKTYGETSHENDGSTTSKKKTKTKNGLGKEQAVKLLKNLGYLPEEACITYACRNCDNNYWANPFKTVLDQDWVFILDDFVNRKLYFFLIPAHSVSLNDFSLRTDKRKPGCLKIQITYGDIDFINKGSKAYPFSFKPFFKDVVSYDKF